MTHQRNSRNSNLKFTLATTVFNGNEIFQDNPNNKNVQMISTLLDALFGPKNAF